MSGLKIVALILIIAGVAGLLYGHFSYTKATHSASVGPFELKVKEKQTVNVPQWAGIGAIVVGVILLLMPQRR